MNRMDRLVGILLELQARGELRAGDLARTFEVSVRTIYRDVQALAETGVPVVATLGKGYRLMEGYFLPPLSFTGSEAVLRTSTPGDRTYSPQVTWRPGLPPAHAQLLGV